MLKFLLFAGLFSVVLESDHKFYVSNTTIEHRPNEGVFQITMKIFTDDLEEALTRFSGEKTVFSEGASNTEHARLINDYLNKNFQIRTDGIRLIQNYLGKETEHDLTFLYLECTAGSSHVIAEITNTVLIEVYSDQINLINFKYGGMQITRSTDLKNPTVSIR